VTGAAAQVKLRPYQQECIDECLKHYAKGIRRQVVSLPVGSGKTVGTATVIFSNLITRIPPPKPKATRTLVVAHREELIMQAAKQIARFAPHLRVDVDQGVRHAIPASADVVVASVPTLGRKGSSRLEKYDPDEFKCIIIDEAHHAAAASYRRILDHFGMSTETDSHVFVWGCSATVRRHDRARLDGAFDFIAYHKDFMEMVDERWLSDLRVTTITTNVDLNKVRSLANEFQQKQLSNAVNTPERNELVVRSFLEYGTGRRSILGFAVDVQHVKDLTAAFRAHGIDARYLTGTTPSDERAELLENFRNHSFPVLINCGILTEGTDIPNIDCLLMARPTRSQVLFQQMLGRGMRLSPHKKDCLVLDFVDSVQRQSLVTIPTLLGLDERVVLKDEIATAAIKSAQEKPKLDVDGKHDISVFLDEEAPKDVNLLRSVTVTEYTSLEDFSGGKREARVRKLSQYNWLCVGDDAYTLSLRDATVRVDRDEDNADPLQPLVNAQPMRGPMVKRGFTRYYTLHGLNLDTLGDAIDAADRWANARGGFIRAHISWNAPWRRLPATETQLRLLRKHNLIPPDAVPAQADANTQGSALPKAQRGWTKGRAADLITRLFEGGLKEWRKYEKERKDMEERTMRQREEREAFSIQVGPM
ncbi:P-loop containing nucleoside triphosphate hydrolase protein, partial [Thamnocephalis sphaerospora]